MVRHDFSIVFYTRFSGFQGDGIFLDFFGDGFWGDRKGRAPMGVLEIRLVIIYYFFIKLVLPVQLLRYFTT